MSSVMRNRVFSAIGLFIVPSLCAAWLLAASCMAAAVPPPLNLKSGDRMIVIGDSITREGTWWSMAELYLLTRFPELDIRWMNAGISGDHAPGTLSRIEWDVLQRNPTHALVMLGINDIGLTELYLGDEPASEEDRQRPITAYRNAMEALVVKLTEAGIMTVLCTPSPYDETSAGDRPAGLGGNQALAQCAQITRDLAQKYDLALIDFYAPMQEITEKLQQTSPSFTLIGKDRIHPGAFGQTVMTYYLLTGLNMPGLVSSVSIDAASGSLVVEAGSASNVTVNGKTIAFDWIADALPFPLVGPAREAAGLVPFQSALNQEELQIVNLPESQYVVRIDGVTVGTWRQDELAAGINLAEVYASPRFKQAEKLSALQSQRHGILAGIPRMKAFLQRFTLPALGVDADDDEEAFFVALQNFLDRPNDADPDSLALGSFARTMAERVLEGRKSAMSALQKAEALNGQIEILRQSRSFHYEITPEEPDASHGKGNA